MYRWLGIFLVFGCMAQEADLDFQPKKRPTREYFQWFVGPFLTPTPVTTPPGHPAIEYEVFILNNYGRYDSHWNVKNVPDTVTIFPAIDFQVGFSDKVSIEFFWGTNTNISKGTSYTDMTDLIFSIGYQLLTDKKGTWIPDMRLILSEIFPTGNYHKLRRQNFGTDVTGTGSFQTGMFLAMQKQFIIDDESNINIRLAPGFFIPASVHVTGISAYGGSSDTSGRVKPGSYFTGFFSFEYAVSRKWTYGFETNYTQSGSGSFTGRRGKDLFGDRARFDLASSVQWSLLPFVERTFNAQHGFVIGSWFSVLGRNSNAFAGLAMAYLHLF